MTSSHTSNGDDNNSMDILDRTHKVIQAEHKLTALLERVEPWLGNNTTTSDTASSSIRDHYGTRVRPIPQTMSQVENILSLARTWSSKTSAPAGWDPSAPVMGFATPNPLPHHLRGGALAALQLERATQAKVFATKRKEEERQSKAKAAQEEQEALERQKQLDQQHNEETAQEQSRNPKKRMRVENTTSTTNDSNPHSESQQQPRPPVQQQQQQQKRQPSVGVSMNLSDSSSEEEEEESDDEMSE